MNIASTIAHGRQHDPDRPALIFEDQSISYAALDAAACRAAAALQRLGITTGDRVALLLPNVPAFVYAYFGALKLGAIVVSLNATQTTEETRLLLADSGASVLIVGGTLAASADALRTGLPALAHVLVSTDEGGSFEAAMREADADAPHITTRDLDPSTPAVIVYTSGTTGVPKGATLSHGNVTFAARAKQRYLDIQPDDHLLLFLPLYHCFGQNAILNAGLQAGATIVLQRGFDVTRVLDTLARGDVTMLFGVPATFIVLLDRLDPHAQARLRYCFSAAAPLPVAVEEAWRERFGLRLHQGYGLTETSPFASYNHQTHHRPGSIGVPIDEVEMAIVDVATRARVADGEIGEIVVRGPNVMLGYWNRPEDTAAAIDAGWFRTGDVGRRDAAGYFFIEDRLKDMVIVGGSNVYPVEVENVLFQHPLIADAAVYGVPDAVLGERVRAAVVLTTDRAADAASQQAETTPLSEDALLAWCRERLAPFKTPAAIDFVTELPRNRTGKVLKRVLREQHQAASASRASAGATIAATPQQQPRQQAPHNQQEQRLAIQQWIVRHLSARLDLRGATIDPDASFFDQGLTSIDTVDLAADLERWLGRPVPATAVWSFSTARTLAEHLAPAAAPAPLATRAPVDEPIAIVGMACRYPGAPGIDAFWDLLRQGRDAVTEVPKSRWDIDAFYHPDPSVPGKMTSRWAGILDTLEAFDAAFFGITPREAPHVDPRQRLALELAWEALEDAKIAPDSLAGTRAGVFMATLTNDYDHLLFDDLQRADAYSGAGTANSIVANRLSYFLDLRGPSLALDTACSGSLVAVQLACDSLRRGESTLALAGGVNVNLMPKSNVFFSKAGALSPTGRCRTFDRAADGMVRSDGAGLIVLKTLSQARRDGDTVIALIAGAAVSHDGRSNGLMAPNGEAQQAVLSDAYRRAGVSPADVQYIEAHGTGTKLGDPIEVQALGAVLAPGRDARQRCLLGSVKTNIGHSEAAAGIAGIIKTALALKHRVIPASLHFQDPNPLIPFDRLPFDVPCETRAWPSPDAPLIAGVSGFGFGGTNAHVVLREAPDAVAPGATMTDARASEHASPSVLPLSARTPQALETLARAYRDRLASGDITDPRPFCIAAATGRTHHARRLAIVGDSAAALHAQLDRWLTDLSADTADTRAAGRLVFVFSGQGSHWPRMATELYASEPRFRAALDECERLFAPLTGWSLIEEISRDAAFSRLDQTALTQPAIFAVQWALFTLWRSFGVTPDAVVGHSLGEVAAACAAGAITLAEGVRIVFHRSRLMARVAGRGKTAVVGLSFDEATAAVFGYEPALTVAGSNGPNSSVIAGEPAAVDRLIADLGARGLFCRAIPGVDIAFHSAQMDPLRDELVRALADIAPRPPSIPILSTVTGGFAGLAEDAGRDVPAFDAAYWGRNLREPFRFGEAIARLLGDDCRAFVEVSPHPVLTSSILQAIRRLDPSAGAPPAALCSMRKNEPARATLLGQVAQLYERGEAIDWIGLCGARVTDAALPSYPWQRQRFWFDQLSAAHGPRAIDAPRASDDSTLAAHPLLGERVEPAIAIAAPGADRVCLWEKDIDASHPAWLGDHRVLDDVFVPGAAFLEMATAAARQLWDAPVRVRDMQFEQALRVTTRRRVQITLTVRSDAGELQLFSRESDTVGARTDKRATATATAHAWVRHAACRVEAVANTSDDFDDLNEDVVEESADAAVDVVALDPLRARLREAISSEQHYDAMKRGGLDYGPAFRGIRQMWAGVGEALADVRVPQSLADARYAVHPAMLDAALQVIAAAVRRDDADSYLPRGVRAWRVFRSTSASDRVWCHARLMAAPSRSERDASKAMVPDASAPDGTALLADVDLRDDAGRLVARASGLALARVGTRRGNPLDAALLEERWLPMPLDADAPVGAGVSKLSMSAAWLVFADAGGVGERLAASLQKRGQFVTIARQGAGYRWIDEQRVELRADSVDDMRRLIADSRPLTGVVHAWSLDARMPDHASEAAVEAFDPAAPSIYGSALHLTQALAQSTSPDSPRLWFVTRRAFAADAGPLDLSQAPLAGLALTVAQEHPELRCSSLDLDADDPDTQARHIAAELQTPHDESRIAWRGGARTVARLARVTLPPVAGAGARASAGASAGASASASATDKSGDRARDAAPTRLRADATYLITGGLGALGLRTAAAFAARGAGHLVLTGRRGAQGKEASIDALTRLGATVTIVEADIANRDDVDRLFRETLAALPPLAGVLHAAGVLDDGVIGQQTVARFEAVLAPKARGLWNLHRHTRHQALDFFVAYSSAASLVGSAGQANYAAGNAFLDALAHHRRALGLPAISINWGAWEEEGMAATPVMRARLEARGVDFIRPGDALPLLFSLIGAANHAAPGAEGRAASGAQNRAQSGAAIGVMPVAWDRFLRQFPTQVPTRFAALAGDTPRPTPASSFTAGAARDAWRSARTAPKAERRAGLRRLVSQELASVLGFDSTTTIAADERYFDLGMDSLMAVELKNRLQQTFGVPLPATLAFEYPTVTAVAALLDDALGAAAASAAPAPLSEPISEPTPDVTLDSAPAAEAQDLDALSEDELTQLLARELASDASSAMRKEVPRVR